MKDYDYDAGAKLLNSTLTFDEFLTALRSGLVVLNVTPTPSIPAR